MISLSNWMSVNNVTLVITKSMSRLFRVFVEATSLILSKINSQLTLNFKAPPPHEIWLTRLRRIWLAAASRSHRYDLRCLRKMWLTAAASWLRLRRLPVACYKAGLPTVTHRVAKLLFLKTVPHYSCWWHRSRDWFDEWFVCVILFMV